MPARRGPTDMKLQNKIPLYVVMVILVLGGLGSMTVLSIQRQASTNQFQETASALTATILNGLEQDMLANERGDIQKTLDSLRQRDSVGEVDIISAGDQIWASTNRQAIGSTASSEVGQLLTNGGQRTFGASSGNGFISVAEPIPVKDSCLQCHGRIAPGPNQQHLLGAIRVDISTAVLDESLNRNLEIMLSLGGLIFVLVAGTIVFLLRRSILSPLSALTAAAGNISRGNYSTRVPVANKKNELGAVSVAFNDMVNQVEEHTAQLQQANRELERVSRMKSEFLANMSHELRTPLNVIIGFSEVLRDTPPESLAAADRQEFCDNIISSGYHLLELINDVLDLAKVEAGQMQLAREEFYIGPALTEIISTMQPLAAKKGISLGAGVSERLSSIMADAGKFKQIVYNLVSNAIKFTPDGGRVTVSAAVMGNMARFEVTDTGVGIAASEHEKIFTEFQQVDGSASRQYEGTGLGLALTRKFVEMQGGRIWVDSELGAGSTFYFTLPLPRENSLPAAIPAERPAASLAPAMAAAADGGQAVAQTEASGVEQEPTRILVVEDDRKTAELIGLWLSQEGYDVDFAADGVEAVEKAREVRPFAICLDIMLPKLDGWQVIHRLKSDPATADAGVIICSALDNPELGFALGAADYCVKPLSRRPLLDKLRRLQRLVPSRRSQPQVLVADGDASSQEATAGLLERQGFSVLRTAGAEETTRLALELNPDIIILDLQLSDGSGYDVLSFLRHHPVTLDIPVIVTAAKDLSVSESQLLDKKQVRKVIGKGGDTRQLLLNEVFRLEKLNPERARLLDPETGLYNRRYFEKRLAEEMWRARRYSLDMSALLIRIDPAGATAPSHGSMLAVLAGMLRSNVRAADPLARYDDDCFAVLLPETSGGSSLRVAGKVVDLVRDMRFKDDAGFNFHFTVSVAVIDCASGELDPQQMMKRLKQTLADIIGEGGDSARQA